MEKNLEELKKRLEEEKKTLEKELASVGRKSQTTPSDWEAVPPETESEAEADKNLAADLVEGFEQAAATEGELEQRLASVREALKKIAEGAYGLCRVCGKEIEVERLEANPAATTCIEHRDY